MVRRGILICRHLEDVSQRAAELFVQLADEAISAKGRFAVALSGGSTPRALYTLLASDSFRDRVTWPKVHLFWGDERCVPPDHPDSNYHMARESLLDQVPIPQENVHRMPAEQEDHERAAADYEETLQTFFGLKPGQLPRFDLILLGMGEDGHTASLFPGTLALKVTDRLVAANYVEKLKAQRLTLTVPVINNAATVVFLISGASKARVLKDVLEGQYDPMRLPSQLIRPSEGRLIFIVDHAARCASLLPP
ncbi:MAG: 6-phosphogluconolactonase [Acidobacteria bacterium]|nr:6-phosphogluconolactonase [Acidobacteriota bacterium]